MPSHSEEGMDPRAYQGEPSRFHDGRSPRANRNSCPRQSPIEDRTAALPNANRRHNPHAFGTYVMTPAVSASRAGVTPEASRDR